MAYGCEDGSSRRCPMAPYFSAKDQELPDGRPLGDEDHDNVRIMNENAAAMAAWRATVIEDENDDDDDDGSEPESSTPSDSTIIEDHEVDCPASDRCEENEASMRKESDDGECEELCVCRENCEATEVSTRTVVQWCLLFVCSLARSFKHTLTATIIICTQVALWIAYTFAGFECGEC